MTRYRIHNILWEYEILVENGIVLDSTINVQERKHWVVGQTLEFLKEYYDARANHIVKTVIEEIEL
jgi:hypothetical protein